MKNEEEMSKEREGKKSASHLCEGSETLEEGNSSSRGPASFDWIKQCPTYSLIKRGGKKTVCRSKME